MAHKLDSDRCRLTLGARGRLVLPSEVRKRLSLGEGDNLLLVLREDGSMTLTPFRVIAKRARWMFRGLGGSASMVDELIAGRRAEAAREGAES